MKNAFLMEAKTIKAGTFWRHSTTTGKAHRGSVKLEGRQRYTPGEKDVGILLKEEEHRKEVVRSFI